MFQTMGLISGLLLTAICPAATAPTPAAQAAEKTLVSHMDEFRLCYEKESSAGKPELSGRVVTKFTIGQDGKVTKAGIKSTTLKNQNIEQCLISAIKRIEFQKLESGTIEVSYPFDFSKSKK
jgi:outer membrane biosynthesis protein TonB